MPEHDDWFIDQILPHEHMLRSWLRNRFPNLADHDDVIQESYLRLCRSRTHGPVRSPKAYLFATARNIALDRLRHEGVVPMEVLVDDDDLNVLISDDCVREAVERDQKLEMLTKAIQSLPVRCRQIFTLRKVYGLSQQEIAGRMGLSTCTVSAQLSIGLRKCQQYVAAHTLPRDR